MNIREGSKGKSKEQNKRSSSGLPSKKSTKASKNHKQKKTSDINRLIRSSQNLNDLGTKEEKERRSIKRIKTEFSDEELQLNNPIESRMLYSDYKKQNRQRSSAHSKDDRNRTEQSCCNKSSSDSIDTDEELEGNKHYYSQTQPDEIYNGYDYSRNLRNQHKHDRAANIASSLDKEERSCHKTP